MDLPLCPQNEVSYVSVSEKFQLQATVVTYYVLGQVLKQSRKDWIYSKIILSCRMKALESWRLVAKESTFNLRCHRVVQIGSATPFFFNANWFIHIPLNCHYQLLPNRNQQVFFLSCSVWKSTISQDSFFLILLFLKHPKFSYRFLFMVIGLQYLYMIMSKQLRV